MSVTINAFPPLHAFTSARSWVLAIIVLLHVGFFWALSSGLSPSMVLALPTPLIAELFPAEKRPPPEPPRKPVDPVVENKPFVPIIEIPDLAPVEEKENVIQVERRDTPVEVPTSSGRATPAPVLTQPQIDPRRGLSEPLYPAQAIRQGHAGTVLLSVYVLENGRVGDVRIEQSSGYQALDDSAQREAHKWRFKPGMRDGTPVAMWRQVPITFQLKD